MSMHEQALSPQAALPAPQALPAPAARRPIANLFRATANWAVRICVRLGIHADAVSYGSMVAASLAAVCLWQAGQRPWLLIPAALFCYVRLWLNMLDGMVAIAAGQASPRGEILNDLPDRVSDVLIFAGLAHSGLCLLPLGYWTAILAVLTAYVGTFGQAVGTQRQFGGVMSKPWRMVALHVGSWLMLAAIWRGDVGWTSSPTGQAASLTYVTGLGSLTIIDWTLILIIAGCVQTIIVRLLRILQALDKRPSKVAE
jgi:phosphatidylglycerophosphate synthase